MSCWHLISSLNALCLYTGNHYRLKYMTFRCNSMQFIVFRTFTKVNLSRNVLSKSFFRSWDCYKLHSRLSCSSQIQHWPVRVVCFHMDNTPTKLFFMQNSFYFLLNKNCAHLQNWPLDLRTQNDFFCLMLSVSKWILMVLHG